MLLPQWHRLADWPKNNVFPRCLDVECVAGLQTERIPYALWDHYTASLVDCDIHRYHYTA
jgi:hypothetical protein